MCCDILLSPVESARASLPQEPFEHTVNSEESVWTLGKLLIPVELLWSQPSHAPIPALVALCAEDGVLHLSLVKGSKGVNWECLLKGHTPNDPYTASEVQKSLMLERFQAENPGFDFSGASFNGSVPDPKTFMGGVGYNN